MSSSASSMGHTQTGGSAFRIGLFDGTSGAFGSQYVQTCILFLYLLLNGQDHVNADYVDGIGTGDHPFLNGIRGFFGTGFDAKIIKGLRYFFNTHRPGEKIVLVGYSRGGVEACVVANIISVVGIPERPLLGGGNSNQDFAEIVYGEFRAGRLDAARDDLVHRYRCRQVDIDGLLVFDGVGTIGLPRTGILAPLKLFKAQKDPGFDGKLRGSIRRAAHAIPAHETRKPYRPTPLYKSEWNHNSEVVNMILPGNHSDAGKFSITKHPLHNLYLAWALAFLQSLGVPMREDLIRERFPAYNDAAALAGNATPLHPDARNAYAQGNISPARSMTTRLGGLLFGREARDPAKWQRSGLEANIQFHPAFQARDGNASSADPALRAFSYRRDGSGGRYTARPPAQPARESPPNSRSSSGQSTIYVEAELGPFEKNLHGITEE